MPCKTRSGALAWWCPDPKQTLHTATQTRNAAAATTQPPCSCLPIPACAHIRHTLPPRLPMLWLGAPAAHASLLASGRHCQQLKLQEPRVTPPTAAAAPLAPSLTRPAPPAAAPLAPSLTRPAPPLTPRSWGCQSLGQLPQEDGAVAAGAANDGLLGVEHRLVHAALVACARRKKGLVGGKAGAGAKKPARAGHGRLAGTAGQGSAGGRGGGGRSGRIGQARVGAGAHLGAHTGWRVCWRPTRTPCGRRCRRSLGCRRETSRSAEACARSCAGAP